MTSFITSFFFVVLLLCLDHSATMNDPDDFGFGNIGPDTLETENQQEQEPEPESNTSTQQNTAATIHQLATMNNLEDFGFGDVSPNSLEAEHQQEQEQEQNTSTQQNIAATPLKVHNTGETLLFAQGQMIGGWTITEKGIPWSEHCINKPYKKHLRMRWECWMMAQGLINGTTSPPMRKDIAQWGLYAKDEISVETVKNSQRHGEYSWFPNEEDDDSNEG